MTAATAGNESCNGKSEVSYEHNNNCLLARMTARRLREQASQKPSISLFRQGPQQNPRKRKRKLDVLLDDKTEAAS